MSHILFFLCFPSSLPSDVQIYIVPFPCNQTRVLVHYQGLELQLFFLVVTFFVLPGRSQRKIMKNPSIPFDKNLGKAGLHLCFNDLLRIALSISFLAIYMQFVVHRIIYGCCRDLKSFFFEPRQLLPSQSRLNSFTQTVQSCPMYALNKITSNN